MGPESERLILVYMCLLSRGFSCCLFVWFVCLFVSLFVCLFVCLSL